MQRGRYGDDRHRLIDMFDKEGLLELYRRLYHSYGPQHWWPADNPFEVMAGAVLTQNTAWTNVEKALARLRRADCLQLESLSSLRHDTLAELIRPSGYYNVKARRLLNLCRWMIDNGGFQALSLRTTAELRAGLLGVNGVGPETADDILLYAFDRPVFVIDNYTRRLLCSVKFISGDENYEQLRQGLEQALGPDADLFNEYHALIVRHAKEKCRVDKSENGHCRRCFVENTSCRDISDAR